MMRIGFIIVLLAAGLSGLEAPRSWASPMLVTVTDTFDSTGDGVPEALAWPADTFGIAVNDIQGQDYDAQIFFASAKPNGDAGIDEVVLRWYRPEATLEDHVQAEPAPAVLLVHTLHPDMPVATLLARGLRQRGVHAFVIELPGYASRVGAERKLTGVTTLVNAAQAVSDCRRSYDVIAALAGAGLAEIDPDRIAIQGTSLGSFIATSAASLDGRFSQTFLFLSGGDCLDILQNGQKDAFHVHGALQHYGYSGDKLRDLIEPVEPLRIAHRLNPKTTWMFNARRDTVVPPKNATLLAQAIGLDPSHHIWLNGNHYTAFILLPGVLDRMQQELGD